MRRASERTVAIGKMMAQPDRDDWSLTLLAGYRTLATVATLARGPAAALAVFQDAVQSIGAIRPEVQALFDMRRAQVALYGTSAPAIQAQHWFPAAPAARGAAHDSSSASPVSLVVFVSPSCQSCQPGYWVLRRLAAEFGARLSITLVTHTRGYYRLQVIATPAEEVDTLRAYFLDRLALPGRLAIAESPVAWRPDGRRLRTTDPNTAAYAADEDRNFCAIVGRNGKIVALSRVIPTNEALLRGLLTLALDGHLPDTVSAGVARAGASSGTDLVRVPTQARVPPP
jgi:hypothetical protein